MSVYFDGKCENCGKEKISVTIPVHTWRNPGSHGDAEWCLECVQGKKPVDNSKFE
jgi:hypothetical protein